MITRWYQRISTRFALVFYFSFAITLIVFAGLTVWSARETTFTTVKDNLIHLSAFWENYLTQNEFNSYLVRQNLERYSSYFEARLTLLDSAGKVLFDSDVADGRADVACLWQVDPAEPGAAR